MDVAELAPLDRALVELAVAERDGEPFDGKLGAVAWAWVRMDDREQTQWLKYHASNSTMGASLRAALQAAGRDGHDLGVIQGNYDAIWGKVWP